MKLADFERLYHTIVQDAWEQSGKTGFNVARVPFRVVDENNDTVRIMNTELGSVRIVTDPTLEMGAIYLEHEDE